MTPSELRAACRRGDFTRTTSGVCTGRIHANLVVLPKALAPDFRAFCERNPRACPLIEEVPPGTVEPRSAPGADVRTDAPRYRVYRDGELTEEPSDLREVWREDLVSFLLGCSFNFEGALAAAGVPLRHQEQRRVVPMFETSLASAPTEHFSGPLVVSMRPVPRGRVEEAAELTGRTRLAHGAPVHVGAPSAIGIGDVARPDYGEPVELELDDVPMFWACGVTPQAAARRARPPLLLTHAPGHMFVTDLRTGFS